MPSSASASSAALLVSRERAGWSAVNVDGRSAVELEFVQRERRSDAQQQPKQQTALRMLSFSREAADTGVGAELCGCFWER